MEWRKMFGLGTDKKTDRIMDEVRRAQVQQVESHNRLERLIQQTIDARRREHDAKNSN